MQLNQGKFEYNGNCGYQLKPEFMRMNDKVSKMPASSPIYIDYIPWIISFSFKSDELFINLIVLAIGKSSNIMEIPLRTKVTVNIVLIDLRKF